MVPISVAAAAEMGVEVSAAAEMGVAAAVGEVDATAAAAATIEIHVGVAVAVERFGVPHSRFLIFQIGLIFNLLLHVRQLGVDGLFDLPHEVSDILVVTTARLLPQL